MREVPRFIATDSVEICKINAVTEKSTLVPVPVISGISKGLETEDDPVSMSFYCIRRKLFFLNFGALEIRARYGL